MQVGQTYEIPIPYYTADSESTKRRWGKGILIQETPYLLVFEYKDRYNNICRTSISKNDYLNMVSRKGTSNE